VTIPQIVLCGVHVSEAVPHLIPLLGQMLPAMVMLAHPAVAGVQGPSSGALAPWKSWSVHSLNAAGQVGSGV
jgi:hypothetical protein